MSAVLLDYFIGCKKPEACTLAALGRKKSRKYPLPDVIIHAASVVRDLENKGPVSFVYSEKDGALFARAELTSVDCVRDQIG